MSKDRVYLVMVQGQPSRLVRATHPLNAVRHVTERLLSVKLPTQNELIALVQAGARVEEATDPAPDGDGQDHGQQALGLAQ